MKKEKITIKDYKRKPQLIIDADHPHFESVKTSMMPDEFREKMGEISNVDSEVIEDQINDYYKQLETPYDDTFQGIVFPFRLLVPMDIIINWKHIEKDYVLY